MGAKRFVDRAPFLERMRVGCCMREASYRCSIIEQGCHVVCRRQGEVSASVRDIGVGGFYGPKEEVEAEITVVVGCGGGTVVARGLMFSERSGEGIELVPMKSS
uniref:Uncharacterized protein n=1 Tax=Ananas comosus var. bracteatus TaxID=296719 RepID=A0A6V7Q2F6_ANACO|nr:unnamed protein product [Ananas comosus var. bracteatus]